MSIILGLLCALLGFAAAWSPDWAHSDSRTHGKHGDLGHGEDQLTVSTSSGHIHGKIDAKLPHVRQFLGIPYAQPPVGELRWEAPRPMIQPDAQIDATELPPSCYQFLGTPATVYNHEVLEFNLQGLNRTGDVSEDCLTASVWTPARQRGRDSRWWRKDAEKEALPVLIYIYGGAFVTGGEDVPYQIPAQWVNRSPNHIVVSFNYRLNIFGFPGANGLETQNFGLLDQRAAVEWCKENIATFGGDPTRMVIWGQSAGAASVDYYSYTYPEDPIVSGLIMDSGTVGLDIISTTNGATFSYVASQVGCDGLTSDPNAQVACMRNVSADTIEGFIANHSNSGASPTTLFYPVPDDKIVFFNYTERALAGKQADIPAIIGTNSREGVVIATYNPDGPNENDVHKYTLKPFFCPATDAIALRQQTGRLTYSFLYSGNFSNISPAPWMGAYHSAELPLIFGTHSDFRTPSTQLEYETSHAMQDAWAAFAADPVHGLESQHWPVYAQLGAKEVRGFGAEEVAAQDISVAGLEAECN